MNSEDLIKHNIIYDGEENDEPQNNDESQNKDESKINA